MASTDMGFEGEKRCCWDSDLQSLTGVWRVVKLLLLLLANKHHLKMALFSLETGKSLYIPMLYHDLGAAQQFNDFARSCCILYHLLN